jgi:GNAT superfamily N-acetyltransferase
MRYAGRVVIDLETAMGSQIASAIAALARLRISVFREWPYLYDGDEDYEHGYLEVYAQCPGAAVILARDGGDVVGASTCLPMVEETGAVRAPFESRGIDVNRFFYFGESVLLPAFRGQGVGLRFFEVRERVARNAAADFAVFCAVRRPDNHPARPRNSADMPRFWRQRGYAPLPGVFCQMAWKEIGHTEPLDHALDFWIKPLGAVPVPDCLA